MPLQIGQKLEDKYTIIKEIGIGGFGKVYLAKEDITNVDVAIKALRQDLSDESAIEARGRFEREIRIGRHLKSDHTVTMHTFTRKGNNIYLVMEYMPGGSLADLLEPIKFGDKPPLSIEDAIHFTRDVCLALDYLHNHAMEFIHRDVTPYNILLDEKGHAKLMDFGLVQEPGSSSGRSRGLSGEHPGHSSYKSPEAENTHRHLTPTSDIYMLGTVLFELLTGRLYKNRPDTPPGELRPDIPPELDAVVLQAVAEDPKDRYRTAAEFDAALKGIETQLDAFQKERAQQARLADLYTQLTDAIAAEQWQKALNRVAEIEVLDTDYKETMQLKAAAETQINTSISPKDDKAMVRVPAGEFLYGDEKEKRTLPEFWIDKTPVTNAEYARFIKASGYKTQGDWEGTPKGKATHPVVEVNWHDAKAYAEWAGKRLPTEEEWEKAARGTDGRKYPWGDAEPDRSLANYERHEDDTTPVGKYSPQGDSPYGCVDMSGNVWEWCADWYDVDQDQRVLRGGSWSGDEVNLRAAVRNYLNPDYSYYFGGFRCVLAGSAQN